MHEWPSTGKLACLTPGCAGVGAVGRERQENEALLKHYQRCMHGSNRAELHEGSHLLAELGEVGGQD